MLKLCIFIPYPGKCLCFVTCYLKYNLKRSVTWVIGANAENYAGDSRLKNYFSLLFHNSKFVLEILI